MMLMEEEEDEDYIIKNIQKKHMVQILILFIYGIRIDLEISDSVTFEVCLENVFKDNIEFSNNVQFRRGYNKYICNNEWVIGLPCLDENNLFMECMVILDIMQKDQCIVIIIRIDIVLKLVVLKYQTLIPCI